MIKNAVYFDEKSRKKKKRILKLKICGGLTAFFILIIGAGYLIAFSPLLDITRINVELNANERAIKTTINIEQLTDDLKKYFISQSKIAEFLGFENILIWKQEKIEEFLKNYPQIAELKIEKKYLERTIKISIREREKFGVWCQYAQMPINVDMTQIDTDKTQINTDDILINADRQQRQSASKCGWFDKIGILFSEAPFIKGNLINKIDDFSYRDLKIGDRILEEKFFNNLIKIFGILEKSDLKINSIKLEKLEFQEIIADKEENFSPKIYFSLRIDPDFGLSALESLKNFGLEKIEYIDLRIMNRAYYKIR